jgi:hypothetical protein
LENLVSTLFPTERRHLLPITKSAHLPKEIKFPSVKGF